MTRAARHNAAMIQSPDILCIGSVLWDVIGRAPVAMRQGSDVAGRITRLPGGVALNIAMTLARFGLTPALLTAIGRDTEGEELMAACGALGLITDTVYRADDLPTDRYMAVEGRNGVIAAIADAHTLEAAGDKILQPLTDGTLGRQTAPYSGLAAIDGNLTIALLSKITTSPLLQKADLRVAPASPGKAERLAPFVDHGRGTLYVNLEEAGVLCQTSFDTSNAAAQGLLDNGAARVLVTNGAEVATDGTRDGLTSQTPPAVHVTLLTGAGDTFMAAHIAAEARGADRDAALAHALDAAAAYVSGKTPA